MLVALFSTLAQAAPPPSASAAVPALDAAAVPGRLIVKFKAQLAPSEAARLITSAGGQVETTIAELGVTVVSFAGFDRAATSAMRGQLQADPHVEYAEPDTLVSASWTPDELGAQLAVGLVHDSGPAGLGPLPRRAQHGGRRR